MDAKLLRLAYVCEFLLAILAIFTAWSEIGGQSALDVMHWGWKIGLATVLSLSIVGLTASWVNEAAIFNLRSARWLAFTLLLLAAMGAVTYYYSLEEDSDDSEDPPTISLLRPEPPAFQIFLPSPRS